MLVLKLLTDEMNPYFIIRATNDHFGEVYPRHIRHDVQQYILIVVNNPINLMT